MRGDMLPSSALGLYGPERKNVEKCVNRRWRRKQKHICSLQLTNNIKKSIFVPNINFGTGIRYPGISGMV